MFNECPNDLNAMVDAAKTADLVLLLVDASFGFEMVRCEQSHTVKLIIVVQETFEFLNVLQAHGFPRIMGVLTHLDSFKENKR